MILRHGFLALVCAGALVAPASAQIVLDNFDGPDVGSFTDNGTLFGGEAVTTSNVGANSSAGSLELQDGGFSFDAAGTYTAPVATTDTYKLTFFADNGAGSTDPLVDLRVTLSATVGGNTEQTFVDIPDTVSGGFVAYETSPILIDSTADVEVLVTANSGGGTFVARFDEFELVQEAIPLSVTGRPLTGFIVDETINISATPNGGSGSFDMVEFDIGGDGSTDFTDNDDSDGFNFPFDTTLEADGPTSVVLTLTDSLSNTATDQVDYTIINTLGVETLFADSFENFTTGVPDNWVIFNQDDSGNTAADETNFVITQESSIVADGASSLALEFLAGDFTFRYTLRSNLFAGDKENYILRYFGQGGSDVRMRYFVTDDGGATFAADRLVNSNSTASAFAEIQDSAYSPEFVAGNQLTVATHKFNASTGYWDGVDVTASNPAIPNNVTTWDAYE